MTRNWMLLLLSLAVSTAGQDSNFGRKVKCFVKDGQVLCPGCNSRAGLSCPRNRKMDSCRPQTQPPYVDKETTQTEIYEQETSTPTIDPDIEPSNTTKTILTPTISQEEIDWVQLANDNKFRLFIYRILKPVENERRKVREVPREEEDDTCNFNGDCPCPLICCKMGDGCPKRCMMGIRLPPPWG